MPANRVKSDDELITCSFMTFKSPYGRLLHTIYNTIDFFDIYFFIHRGVVGIRKQNDRLVTLPFCLRAGIKWIYSSVPLPPNNTLITCDRCNTPTTLLLESITATGFS